MKKFGSFPYLVLVLSLLSTFAYAATVQQTPAPVLFFIDLTSGPNSGNSDPTYSATGGAYVTLYGNFLDNFTSVQLNGASCLTVVSSPASWMWYERMVVKVGTGCSSGNFTVSTAAGTSNGIAFTVTSGHQIYYVSTSGNDTTGAGSFSSPWRTFLKARDKMVGGDITYVENGVAQTADDGNGWNTNFLVSTAGSAGNPIAIGAYPGATATIGSTSGGLTSIRSHSTGTEHYWTFFSLVLRATEQGMNPYKDHDWRVVGNDFSCPSGNSPTGCFESTIFTFGKLLGNNFHDMGTPGGTNQYHGVYWSTDSNHQEFGWNTIANVGACRGIQIHSSPLDANTGFEQFDFQIHDNIIHDTQCDGIGIYTIDPSKGAISIYNNVIYNAGRGNPSDGSGDWACIYIAGYVNNGPDGSGTVNVYNNTMYNCAPITNPPYPSTFGIGNGGNSPAVIVTANNNLIYNTNSGTCSGKTPCASYMTGSASLLNGTKNLMFGVGSISGSTCVGCSNVTAAINSNPGFVSTSTPDFHLSSSGSPANGTGSTSVPVPTYDITGLPRPSPPAIGAYEFAAASVAARPSPPTNLTGVVQ